MTSIGTPIYMAPEVIKHTRYSEKADVYSYGIVLCEILTQTTAYADEMFQEMTTDKLVLAVATQGLRPIIPERCPQDYQTLIHDCINEVQLHNLSLSLSLSLSVSLSLTVMLD
jgi:serine/threonine protein kinase